MKIAIISDIHSNLEALKKVLEFYQSKKADSLFFLGDLVGYGPSPCEACDLMKKYIHNSVMGNHDYAVSYENNSVLDTFNLSAREMVLWTRNKLNEKSPEYLEILRDLPLLRETENLTFVHSTPYRPQEWNYIFNIRQAYYMFYEFKTQICFVGHSHQPYILEKNPADELTLIDSNSVTIKKDHRYIINIGSVGQPRDLDNRACIAFLDISSGSGRYELYRLDYDIKKTQHKMRERNLPKYLIDRLKEGK